jgi:periplasmic protein TonB
MFGVLIESKAGRQRRAGGTLLSILVHGTVIAGAIAATTHVHTARATEPPVPDVVYRVRTRPPDPTPPAPRDPSTVVVPTGDIVIIPPVEPPTVLPPITTGPVIDDPSKFFITAGAITHDSTLAGGGASVADPNAIRLPDQVEKMATPRFVVRPTYPEQLRLAGIGGRVVVRFVVDTLGLVEHESVVVREASHARFENAVRDVLPRMRFTPAQLDGRPVRMLVEMPFEFAISR